MDPNISMYAILGESVMLLSDTTSGSSPIVFVVELVVGVCRTDYRSIFQQDAGMRLFMHHSFTIIHVKEKTG